MNKLKVLLSSQNHQKVPVARLFFEDDASFIELEKMMIREDWGSYVRFLMSGIVGVFRELISCLFFFFYLFPYSKKYNIYKTKEPILSQSLCFYFSPTAHFLKQFLTCRSKLAKEYNLCHTQMK